LCAGVLGVGLGMLCGGISAVMEKWRDVSQSFDFQVKVMRCAVG